MHFCLNLFAAFNSQTPRPLNYQDNYTDYDIEGTEIEGTVLKFLKNKGHQYWNLLPQGTGEIQI